MGYIGHSMSERAYEAYESGEKPRTQWSKRDFRRAFPELDLSKLSLADCRKNLLVRTSWHHTGKYYARTDFYSPKSGVEQADIDRWVELESVCESKNIKKPCKAVWYEWEGTGRHKHREEYKDAGYISGDWFYGFITGMKKSVKGAYFFRSDITEPEMKELWRNYFGTVKGWKAYLKNIKNF